MSKNPADILNQVLRAENRSHANVPISQDPVVETEMVLPISQINPYDNNPRKAKNSKYEELKLSISKRGYTSVLEITRRPGDENYMVCAGANTTLTIIKELYAQTNEARFAKLRCLFKPWQNESEVIFNHLIENTTHGSMIFIDKARGVLQAKAELEKELHKQLSQREFCQLAKERCGFSIDPPTLGRYIYTVNYLTELIPTALASGIGNLQIKKIKQLEEAYKKYQAHHQLVADLTGFNMALSQADGAYDNPDSFFYHITEAIEQHLSAQHGVSKIDTRLELRALLETGELAVNSPPAAPTRSAPTAKPNTNTTAPKTAAATKQDAPPAEIAAEAQEVEQTAEAEAEDTASQGAAYIPNPTQPTAADDFSPASDDIGTNTDDGALDELSQQRQRAAQLAGIIARFFDVDEYLQPVTAGNGFVMDFPQDKSELAEHQGACWYYLATMSEQIRDYATCSSKLAEPSSYKFYIEAMMLFEQEQQYHQSTDEETADPFTARVGQYWEIYHVYAVLNERCDEATFAAMTQLQTLHFHFSQRAKDLGAPSMWSCQDE